MSAAAWMQVVLLSGVKWDVAIRALHKAVHRTYQTSPHATSATVKCLCNMTTHMPERRCVVVSRVGVWPRNNAYWQGGNYPPPPRVVPHPLSFPGGGGGGCHLVNPKFFIADHCVVVWVTVLWGTATCIPCTHGRTFCSFSLKWNLIAQPWFPLGQV